MGTHMWNSNPSRRGRRMSIDLPSLHITAPPNAPPPTEPPAELGSAKSNQQNSDIFFPYIPPHFLNGDSQSL